jgi:hypothetical protein
MTSPIVTETTAPPEPTVPDPFIDDVSGTPAAPAPTQPPRRRRIWD